MPDKEEEEWKQALPKSYYSCSRIKSRATKNYGKGPTSEIFIWVAEKKTETPISPRDCKQFSLHGHIMCLLFIMLSDATQQLFRFCTTGAWQAHKNQKDM